PLRLRKVGPPAVFAVRITLVPLSQEAVQVLGQLMNASLEVTVPFPAWLTVRVKRCALKVTVTNFAALMVTVQVVPETVSHPLQPLNVDALAGLAVRITLVPLS